MKRLLLIICAVMLLAGCSPENDKKDIEIYNKYNTMQVEFTTLKNQYEALKIDNQRNVKAKEELTALKAENYKLTTDNNAWQTKYNIMEYQYNNLNTHYGNIFSQLSSTQTNVEDSYNSLLEQYQLLESDYSKIAKPKNWSSLDELKEFLEENEKDEGKTYVLDEDGSMPMSGACVYIAEHLRNQAYNKGRYLDMFPVSPTEYENIFDRPKEGYHATLLARVGNYYYCIEPDGSFIRKAYHIP